MLLHYCPSCGRVSSHGPGSVHFALTCPHCEHVAKQHPHPPTPAPRERRVVTAEAAGEVAVSAATPAPARKRRAKKATAEKPEG